MTDNDINIRINELNKQKSEASDLVDVCALQDMIHELKAMLPKKDNKVIDPICDDNEGCLMCGS